MTHIILAAAALGIAGFDPLGFVALVAAMAIGARRSGVAALMASSLLSTFLFGFIPALALGPAVWRMSEAIRRVSHLVWGPLTVALGIGLLVWGVVRLARPPRPRDEHAPIRAVTPAAMAFTGILVGLSAFIDPAFYGAIVLAARQPNPVANAVVIASWIALSHSALILMGTATLVGWFEPVNHFLTRMRQRWGATANQAFTIALLLAGLFGLVQGIAEWRGHWLDLGLHLHSRPHR